METHILLIDDDILAGKLLAFLLADGGYAMTVLTDPRRADAFLRENAVDLVLLDIMLPYVDGYAIAQDVRRAHPDIPIIFLSGRAAVRDKIDGFIHGADDYVVKPFEPTELLSRIQAVLRRYRRAERNVFGSHIKVGDTTLDMGELQFSAPHCRAIGLTPTETKLLECLMRNANAAISREALVLRVWGYDDASLGNRVDVYIRRLRSKIEADASDPVYIETVRGIGYVFREGKRAVVAALKA